MNTTARDHRIRMRMRSWAIVIILLVVSYAAIDSWLISGPLQVPKTDIFLSNYDNFENLKTWDQLRTEHKSLDPSLVPTTSPFVALNILPVDMLEELEYPKTVVALHFEFTLQSGTPYISSPTLLILVLDGNNRIRGKLFTPIAIPEPQQAQAQVFGDRFWFTLPKDMVEGRYEVVAEWFGAPPNPYQYYPGVPAMDQMVDSDNVYGALPAWQYEGSIATRYALLDFARDDNRIAPPSTFSWRNMLGDVSLISALIPAVGATFYALRKRLGDSLQNPDLSLGIGYLILSLVLFVILIADLVLFR